MNTGNAGIALINAEALMKEVTLRKSKKALIDGRLILSLPKINVRMIHIDFTEDERLQYDYVNQTAQARFIRYMAEGVVMQNVNLVLTLLLHLIQVCLHPGLILKRPMKPYEEADLPEKESRQKRLASQMSQGVVSRLLSDSTSLLVKF